MAQRIGGFMEGYGVKFIRDSIPTKLEAKENGKRVITYTTNGVV